MATRRVAKKEIVKETELPTLHSSVDSALQARIVEHLKQNHRVAAIQEFRMATGENLDVATASLLAWWNKIQTDLINTDEFPAVCCYNCLGACGRRKDFIVEHGPKLYNISQNAPCGADGNCCHRFLSARIVAEMKKPSISLDSTDGSRWLFTLESPLIEMINTGNNTGKRIITTDAEAQNAFITALKEAFDNRSVLRHFAELTGTKFLSKVKPLDNEQWDDYTKRVSSAAKERRTTFLKRMDEMSDADVSTTLQEHFVKKGLKEQMKAYPTFESFFQTFYPDTEQRDLLFSIEREEC